MLPLNKGKDFLVYLLLINFRQLHLEDKINKSVKVSFRGEIVVNSVTELKGGMFNSAYLIVLKIDYDKLD